MSSETMAGGCLGFGVLISAMRVAVERFGGGAVKLTVSVFVIFVFVTLLLEVGLRAS